MHTVHTHALRAHIPPAIYMCVSPGTHQSLEGRLFIIVNHQVAFVVVITSNSDFRTAVMVFDYNLMIYVRPK
jgi:hypothetical protein